MKFVRNSNGTDLIPNLSFWSSTPGLVKVNNIDKIINKIMLNCNYFDY